VLLCAMLTILVGALLWSALMNAASEPNRRDAPRAPKGNFAARWDANAATVRDLPPPAAAAPHVVAADRPQPPSEPPSRFPRWSATSAYAVDGIAAREASPPLPVAPPASPRTSFAPVRHRTARSAHRELCAAHGLRRQYYHRGSLLSWRCTTLRARRHGPRA